MVWCDGVGTPVEYFGHTVNLTEPIIVVVIVALASIRPVVRLAENWLSVVASIGGRCPVAWWTTILTVAPSLGPGHH